MTLIKYENHNFKSDTLEVIGHANKIIESYESRGYNLTLRQLYYQFVSQALIPNSQREYKRLGDIISKGRRAGLISWKAIVDRTRGLKVDPANESASELIEESVYTFALNPWHKQKSYVEVWFEKDALMGVFDKATRRFRVPYFSCRGYTSDSEIWNAAMRLRNRSMRDQEVHVIHFGDHDPSGIDMTRDIIERLALFAERPIDVRRLALNMNQIDEFNPPPNPAKETDSRYVEYHKKYGYSSWELDALKPETLCEITEREVRKFIDMDEWNESLREEDDEKRALSAIAENWEQVKAYALDID